MIKTKNNGRPSVPEQKKEKKGIEELKKEDGWRKPDNEETLIIGEYMKEQSRSLKLRYGATAVLLTVFLLSYLCILTIMATKENAAIIVFLMLIFLAILAIMIYAWVIFVSSVKTDINISEGRFRVLNAVISEYFPQKDEKTGKITGTILWLRNAETYDDECNVLTNAAVWYDLEAGGMRNALLFAYPYINTTRYDVMTDTEQKQIQSRLKKKSASDF